MVDRIQPVTIVATPAMKALLLAAGVLRPCLSGTGPHAVVTLRRRRTRRSRVFIRSGPKSHGPGAHDYPRFLKEWVPLLNERGARATGAEAFPTRAQLDATDVLVLHAQEAGNIADAADRANLNAFLARGGGLVVIHAGAVSRDPDWFKGVVGGSWREGTTKWLEGPMHLYFTDRDHAITSGASNWSMDDEIYYDMDILPEARVLAAAYTPKPVGARDANALKRAEALTGGGKTVSIYDIQPQMWTYERTAEGGATPYRAFVSIPGHLYENFNRPNYRALLLRGIAWAGKRSNVDALLRPDEIGDGLRYVDGGPTHPDKAAATIEVHPEFDLSLVAAEPLIQKAMNLDWDERGRLWVSETPEYPNGRRVLTAASWKDSGSLASAGATRDPEDTISILSDTNGDGRMDRKHVFADKLELVTGFVLHRAGVIAATAPDIWYLEDTNGDEVADKRTKLYTGLGTADTHAVINNLRWGLDGWIYATHGYSTGAAVTSPDGTKNFGRDGSGVVRFRPDGSAFEQYSSRGGNTWGLDVTWDGQVFWTQPTSGTVLFHTVLPESVLAKGRVPNTTSAKGMISGAAHVPADDVAGAGLRSDRSGRPVHGRGRLRHLRRRCVARSVEGRLLHGRADAEHRAPAVPAARWRELHHGERARPRADGVHAQPRSLVPADRDARRSGRRALHHRLLQSGRHSQRYARAGARSGERRRAARSRSLLRPHLAGAAQAGSATRRAGPRSPRPRQSHPCDGDEPERARQAHRVAPGTRTVRVGSAPGPGPQADGQFGPGPVRTVASRDDERRACRRCSIKFAAATDNWTRSALIAAATEQAATYVSQAFRHSRPEALADFVAGVAAGRAPRQRRAARRRCRDPRPRHRAAQGDRPSCDWAGGRSSAAADRGFDQGVADAAHRSGHDRGRSAGGREVGHSRRAPHADGCSRSRASSRASASSDSVEPSK